MHRARAPYRARQTSVGGEGGIRTRGGVTPTHAFQACSFGHSDTSPQYVRLVKNLGVAEAEASGGRRWCLTEVLENGGEGGIRTPGPRKGSTVFETAPIDHSGTSPLPDPIVKIHGVNRDATAPAHLTGLPRRLSEPTAKAGGEGGIAG